LSQLLTANGNRVRLRFGQEPRDKYGRLLAHVFLDDGTNVEAWLLERGLATTLTYPPNVALAPCYLSAQQRARQQETGLWRLDAYRPATPAQLSPHAKGYRLVRGKVERIGNSRKSVWINLEGAVALRIDRDDLHYFDNVDFQHLVGRTVTARGWLHPYRGRTLMRIRHPAALEIQ
jgi:micrococcal nuclease